MARDFKGVWIPKEIWLHKDLSLIEKCLLIEIDSLDNSPERGCFASNKYFADFFQLSESRIANILTDLKKRGYIKQVYFDGRNRGLRSQHREICFTENGKAELPKKGKQDTRKREHNNTVNNTVENMYSTNVEYRETAAASATWRGYYYCDDPMVVKRPDRAGVESKSDKRWQYRDWETDRKSVV